MPGVDALLQLGALVEQGPVDGRQVVDDRPEPAPEPVRIEPDCRQEFAFDEVGERGGYLQPFA